MLTDEGIPGEGITVVKVFDVGTETKTSSGPAQLAVPAAAVGVAPLHPHVRLAVAVMVPMSVVAEFCAAVCMPEVSLLLARLCAPYSAPARAAVVSAIEVYMIREKSAVPTSTTQSI